MARTQQQIEQEILQAKAQYPELSDLNSPSQTALWRLWVALKAFLQVISEKLFDVFRIEIIGVIETNRTGTTLWYAEKAKAFQLGDVLNNFGEYAVIVPETDAKRIITRASVSEITSGVSIKIAKSEPPTQLSASEIISFNQYINQVKFAGVATNIVNLPAEAVIVNVQIFFKDVSESVVVQSVKDAIKAYIDSISFDGQFIVNDLIVACRAKLGVMDLIVNNIVINSFALTTGRYTSASGYYSFDAENIANNYTSTPF